MRRSIALLIAASAAGLIAACSAGPESSTLGGNTAGNDRTQRPGAGTGSDDSKDDNSATDTPSDNGAPSSDPAPSTDPTTVPPPEPPPATGPGSTASAAHKFFVASVFPAIQNCSACHATGANGAPKFLDANADTAYSSLDAIGLIQTNSRLLVKGVHSGGAAPALSDTQKPIVNQWLGMEAQERAGKAAPVNVLEKLAACMDKAQLTAIGLQTIRTQPRNGENTNRCTGCNNAVCSSCHGDTTTTFYEQFGSKLGDNTFEMSQKQPYILKYFGLNGTEPVASNGILLKQTAVATAPPYSHPKFTMNATVKANLDKFVADTIAKYKAGTCAAPTTTPPAGQ
jgi:cytochrome c5